MSNCTHSRINRFIYPVKNCFTFSTFSCGKNVSSCITAWSAWICFWSWNGLCSVCFVCVPVDVLKVPVYSPRPICYFILKRNCFYMLLCFFIEWIFSNNIVTSEKLPFSQTCLLDKFFCWFCLPQPVNFFLLNKKRVDWNINHWRSIKWWHPQELQFYFIIPLHC